MSSTPDAARHQPDSAERSSQQHLDRQGRQARLCGHSGGTGMVDVIDTASPTKAKSIPIKGAVHNTYVTPDGRYVVAGSIAGKTATAIDARTEEVAWVMEFDLGVRPMAFDTNTDGSTKRMFVQLGSQRLCRGRFRDAQRGQADRPAQARSGEEAGVDRR